MAYRKVSSSVENYFNFTRQGETVEGFVQQIIKDVSTKYGLCNYLVLSDLKTGNPITLVITSNLAFINWEGLKGNLVCITYEGKETNKTTKNIYKKFSVMVDEEAEQVPF